MRRITLALFLALALVLSPLAGISLTHAQGQVYTDSMDSAATGLLSTETFDPSISFAYQNGQFVVNVQQPSYQGDIISTLSVPELASSRLTVDAAIAGEPTNKYVIAGCRHTDAGEGYFFGYLPATGDLLIWRRDTSGDTNIAQSVDASLIAPANATYQIGIDCWTNVITGIVNGQPVVSAFDDTYPTGRPTIGVGANGLQTDGLTVAFDNLTVTDNGNLTLGPETPVAPLRPSSSETTTGQSTAIEDPTIDPDGTLADAFAVSLQTAPIVSDLEGSLAVESGSTYLLSAGVELVDFYAELHFATPDVPADGIFIVGFCFWVDADGNCYDVHLLGDGGGQVTWGYGYYPAVDAYQTLQTGTMPAESVDPTVGATNFLSLTVYQGTAILSGNSFAADAVIPLQGTPIFGDVKSEIAFIDSTGAASATTLSMSTSDFAVWDLNSGVVPAGSTDVADSEPAQSASSGPTLPPVQGSSGVELMFDQSRKAAIGNPALAAGLSGSFTQESDVYAFVGANVNLGDFYSIVTFTNPTDLSAPFDVGLGFRADRGTESGVRFVVSSDGSWYLQQPGRTPIASGAAGFDATAGASNVIELLVQGATAIVAINGTVLPQLDLSSVTTRGDVYAGAGFFQGDTVAGRVIPYSQWWIYPTNVLDFPSG
ncbi:MAG TPA: hypothetical protein VFP05_01200 [Thermomicrobiales bacterium]|nr:hypothetical protein [Thermomicrobiales bacterium]